jgi:hypothetical protein
MPKKTKQEKIKADQRRHHYLPAPEITPHAIPSEATKTQTFPQYVFNKNLTHTASPARESKEITALIDPKEFHAIKQDLFKTAILAFFAFMIEFWLSVRIG